MKNKRSQQISRTKIFAPPLLLLLGSVLIFLAWTPCDAFSPSKPRTTHARKTGTTSLTATSTPRQNPRDDFEWQELRVQLAALQKQGIAPRDLQPATRNTLCDYARNRCIQSPPSSTTLETDLPRQLPGTTWRLVLSNDAATLGDLPRDATVYYKFVNGETVEYTLEFAKTFGLNSIKAKSTWDCDPQGLVTVTYEEITTDAFGLKNVGVGLFGLLQGRTNCIETAYFDGDYWIERGMDPTGTKEFINVYVREEDTDDYW